MVSHGQLGMYKSRICDVLDAITGYGMMLGPERRVEAFTIKIGGHHTQEDFAVRGKEPKDEVQMYTWKDATLRELTDLVKEVSPAVRRRDAKLSFAVVYPEKNGRMQVGETFSNANKRQLDDNRALAEMNFQGIAMALAVVLVSDLHVLKPMIENIELVEQPFYVADELLRAKGLLQLYQFAPCIH
ncbi:hypothetical protein Cgig2_002464 [Carnegiea gigantea]|uniref:Uncharacterized protein n=1 Tax=Carnegiea gigantea TaxID=171969 RepID=A0A9Q1KTW6_9CARY|nr:hypothetical protein Cgig2_002464 [Carnegiea gigantea]